MSGLFILLHLGHHHLPSSRRPAMERRARRYGGGRRYGAERAGHGAARTEIRRREAIWSRARGGEANAGQRRRRPWRTLAGGGAPDPARPSYASPTAVLLPEPELRPLPSDDAPPRESVATGTYRPLPPWILTRMVGVHGAPRCHAYSRSSGRASAAAPPSPEAANQRRRALAGRSHPGSGRGRLASMELRGAAPTRVRLGCLWSARAVPGEGALHFVETCEVR
jgi:hypothetical protein